MRVAGKRHIIALQGAIEYLHHECLTKHFYITHLTRCAVLFIKDTFHSDIQANSVHIHDTRHGQTTSRERGTIRVGSHKPSSPAPLSGGYRAMLNPSLYHDVAPYQQQHAKKHGNGKKLVTRSPYCNASRQVDRWWETSMALHGDGSQAMNIDT